MKFWFEVTYDDVWKSAGERLMLLNEFDVLTAGAAMLQTYIGNEPIDEENLISARSQLKELGLATSETLDENDSHPVWQQGDFLIPMLMGVHPCLALKQIQHALIDMGFSSQEEYRDYISINKLDAILTPFSHARNNAVFSLAFLRNPELIQEKFDGYSNYAYSVLCEERSQNLEDLLSDTNERIRMVLFSQMKLEEADGLLLH
ncbi:hypothetical protein N9X39_06355 [Alphaproteobacteria bacterium]|nr:hypothetical protein [Alphaproteobacteria bacterium]